jgi:hypothetical protein
MTNISAIPNKNKPFVQINRKTIQNSNLSWEARGLWAYILSLPYDWKLHIKHLVSQSPGGRDKVYRILDELKEHGLCYLVQRRHEKGKWLPAEYLLAQSKEELDEHLLELKKCLPLPEKPDPAKPDTANQDVYKEEILHKKDSTNKDLLRRSKVVASAPPPKVSFGEFKRVKLTEDDLNDLVERFGKEKINATIDAVDRWCEENGKMKKNYKLTILNWIKREPQFNPQAKKEEIQQKNRQLASEIKKKLEQAGVQRKIRFDLSSTCLELGSYDHPHVKAISFNENGFRDQLEGFLRKTNLFSLINV